MNKPAILFAITTAIFGASSVYLAHSLSTERAHSANAVARSGPSTTIQAPLPAPLRAALRSDATTATHPIEGSAPDETPVVGSGLTNATRTAAIPTARNESAKGAELAYRKFQLQKQYPNLGTVLNLQPDEANRFFDLLAEQQLQAAEEELARMGSGEPGGREQERERERRRQADRAEQAAVLGEARMADWNKYLNSLGARVEVRELQMLLADSDYPLRRDQYEPLVSSIAAEQIRHNAEREQLRRSMRDQTNPTDQETLAYMNRRRDLIEDSLKRRHRAAATLLDTEQLRRYETMIEGQRLWSRIEYDATVARD